MLEMSTNRRDFLQQAAAGLGLGVISKVKQTNNNSVLPSFFRFAERAASIAKENTKASNEALPKLLGATGEALSIIAEDAFAVNPEATQIALRQLHEDLNLANGENPLTEAVKVEENFDQKIGGVVGEEERELESHWKASIAKLDDKYTPLPGSFYAGFRSNQGAAGEIRDQLIKLSAR